MESSSSTSKFRFRDHQQMEDEDDDATEGDTTPETSSVSSDANDEPPELESMTAKGIKHLCSELFELRLESDEDFHQNVFSNYSTFVRMFKEMEGVKNEVMRLKQHVITQKYLVNVLVDGIYIKVLLKESEESNTEEPDIVQPSESILETRADYVLEAVDFHLSEQGIDKALEVLDLEAETFRIMQLQGNYLTNELEYYNSAIAKGRAMIVSQLKLVAANPRVPSAELLKALVGLQKVDGSHSAIQLLFKHYHSRISSSIQSLQSSGVKGSICEVAKYVYSMISQASRSYLILVGEETPNCKDIIKWASEETELFAASFKKYVKSLSYTSDGLALAVKSVHAALSYCSLLEAQGLVMRPCLEKHIRPSLEEVLQIYVDRYKKVTRIFTSTDVWTLETYLLSGILSKECSSLFIKQQPEYCLLTSSGRKFLSLLQAITEDTAPLARIQMEAPIIRGLIDLSNEYIAILECALIGKPNILENDGPGFELAESLEKKFTIVVNVSNLVDILSISVKSVFKGMNNLNSDIDKLLLYILESSDRLRAHFFQQIKCKTMGGSGCRVLIDAWACGDTGSDVSDDMLPSSVCQGLFSEIRRVQKFGGECAIEEDWLLELMRDLMEAIFISISNDEEMWSLIKEDLALRRSGYFKQFVLDIVFLVEVAKHIGCFSSNVSNASWTIVSHMESACCSAGLDPKRGINEEWASNAARKSLQKLLAEEETISPPDEYLDGIIMNTEEDDEDDDEEDDEDTSFSVKSAETAEIEAISPKGFPDTGGEENTGHPRPEAEFEGDVGDELAARAITDTELSLKHLVVAKDGEDEVAARATSSSDTAKAEFEGDVEDEVADHAVIDTELSLKHLLVAKDGEDEVARAATSSSDTAKAEFEGDVEDEVADRAIINTELSVKHLVAKDGEDFVGSSLPIEENGESEGNSEKGLQRDCLPMEDVNETLLVDETDRICQPASPA